MRLCGFARQFDFLFNYPVVQCLAAHVLLFFRLPISHIEAVRNNARARFQLAEQLGPQINEVELAKGSALDILLSSEERSLTITV